MASRSLETGKEREAHSFEAVESLLSDAALRASEEKFRTFFEAIDQGLAISEVILNEAGEGVDYRIVEANEKYVELTGKPRAELFSGKTIRELIPTLEDLWPRTLGKVATTGEPVRFENYAAALDGWFEIYAFRIGDASLRRVAVICGDVTARRRAEHALQIDERIKAYLLKLSDVLRRIASPVEIMSAAAEAVARELDVAAAGYIEMAEDGEAALIGGQFGDGRLPELAGGCRLAEFGAGISDVLRAGHDLYIPDVRAMAEGPEGGTEKARDLQLRAAAATPLIKNGRMVAFFYAVHPEARPWERWEKDIFHQTAERTWAAVERARAENALRASEEKYRSLFDSIDQAYSVIEMIYEDGVPKDFRVIEGNRVFARQTGIKDYRGKTAVELVSKVEDYWLGTYARVAETGEPIRFENYSEGMGRWFDVFASRVGGEGSRLVSVVFDDITERKRAEEELRGREERKAFLLRLSDALRQLTDPIEVQGTVARMLGEYLHADRTFYAEIDETLSEAVVERDYARDGKPSLVGRYPLEVFAKMASSPRKGEPAMVEDVRATDVIPEGDRAAVSAIQVIAFIDIPLIKDGRLVAALLVTEMKPRAWTPEEFELVKETAERTWAAMERVRAESALRRNEGKYRGLFESIDQGYALLEVLEGENGAATDLRFVEANHVFERQTGYTGYRGRKTSELRPGLDEFWVKFYGSVAATGQPARAERHIAEIDRWFTVFASRVGGDGSRLVSVVFDDITERKAMEAELREREERKAYLLRLSDGLRPVLDPIEIQGTASRLLGEELRADRTMYVEVEQASGEVVVAHDYAREGVASLVGRYPLEAFTWIGPTARRGRPTVVNDVESAEFVQGDFRQEMRAARVKSFIAVPMVKRGRLVGALCVTNVAARNWKPGDVERVQETADRTWAAVERARAEAERRASEEKYRTLFDSIDNAIAVVEVLYDEKGRADNLLFVETNRVYNKMTGRANCIGKTSREVIPDLADSCIQRYASVVATGEPVRFESFAADCGRWLGIFAARVGDERRHLVNIVFEDITERKQTDEALRKSEKTQAYKLRLSEAIRGFSDPAEVQAKAIEVLSEHLQPNRTFYAEIDEAHKQVAIGRDVAGGGTPSLAGRHPLEAFEWMRSVCSLYKKSKPAVVEDVRTSRLLSEEQRREVELLGVLSFIAIPLIKDGKLVAALCVTEAAPRAWTPEDVDVVWHTGERTWAAVQRERAEAALRQSEQRLQRVLETDAVGVLFFDWTGTVTHANDVFQRMTGYTEEDVAQRRLTWRGMTPAEYIPSCEEQVRRLAKTGRLGPLEKEYIMKDGSRRWMLFAGRALGDGTVSEYCIDISEMKRAEAALRDSEERFRRFVENVHGYAFMQVDAELRMTSWNPGAERILGYSSQEALGQPFSMLLLPEDREGGVPCMQLSRIEQMGRHEDARWLLRKDGTRIWARWVSEPIRDKNGRVTGLTKVMRDETDRLRTETSLRESEKLAVVGRMASSIAHEINNPLEAVTNLIYLARKTAVSPETADFLDQAQSELARVSHISKATLHFHRQSPDPFKVDLEEILESVLLLHEGRLRGAHIATERRYGPHPAIRCRENEIRQVMANLVSNALDAMTKNVDDRKLIVRIRKAADPKSGEEGVRVMIADSGAGIVEAAGKRVFEPFYTTKAATGTGLGLWISAEVIKKHEGTLKFRSRTDGRYRGTMFSIFLKS